MLDGGTCQVPRRINRGLETARRTKNNRENTPEDNPFDNSTPTMNPFVDGVSRTRAAWARKPDRDQRWPVVTDAGDARDAKDVMDAMDAMGLLVVDDWMQSMARSLSIVKLCLDVTDATNATKVTDATSTGVHGHSLSKAMSSRAYSPQGVDRVADTSNIARPVVEEADHRTLIACP